MLNDAFRSSNNLKSFFKLLVRNYITKAVVAFSMFAFAGLLLSSCCKRIQCSKGYATLAFVGHNLDDLESLHLRRYLLNSDFKTKIDTIVIVKADIIFDFKQDTVFVKYYTEGSLPKEKYFISVGYDYEVYIPNTGKVYRLTDIAEINNEEKICGMQKRMCSTTVNTLRVNGVNYSGYAVLKK